MGDIRIGKVSSVDFKNGMVKVAYYDKGEAVTGMFPYASFNGEYFMPSIGESVLVAHLSNGSSHGVVISTFWNQVNNPPMPGEHIYRKEFSHKTGESYMSYNAESNELVIKSPNIVFEDASGRITVKELLTMLCN
nr:MAG TPA: baseplate assembly protein V [Caudoviricetes sp.]